MLLTIPLTDGVFVSDRDIRVSVTLNPMILAEDRADALVVGRMASVAGLWKHRPGHSRRSGRPLYGVVTGRDD